MSKLQFRKEIEWNEYKPQNKKINPAIKVSNPLIKVHPINHGIWFPTVRGWSYETFWDVTFWGCLKG